MPSKAALHMEWGHRAAHMGFTMDEAIELRALSRTAHRLNEIACERDTTAREERRLMLTAGRMRFIVEHRNARVPGTFVPLGVKWQQDPRGWPIIILRPGDDEVTGIRVPPV